MTNLDLHANDLNLGQHFLIDISLIKQILKNANLNSSDRVLEVGPGQGILTKELIKATKTIAIEYDQSLIPTLSKLKNPNLKLIFDNALNIIPKKTLHFNKFVSNIPYHISEPLLKQIIKRHETLDLAIILSGEKFYNLLTENDSKWKTIIQLFYKISKIQDVPKESFSPKPRVKSTLFKLEKQIKQLTPSQQILKEVILQDDKKLKNALIKAIKDNTEKKKYEATAITKELLPETILNKNVDFLSNKQFELLAFSINNINI